MFCYKFSTTHTEKVNDSQIPFLGRIYYSIVSSTKLRRMYRRLKTYNFEDEKIIRTIFEYIYVEMIFAAFFLVII